MGFNISNGGLSGSHFDDKTTTRICPMRGCGRAIRRKKPSVSQAVKELSKWSSCQKCWRYAFPNGTKDCRLPNTKSTCFHKATYIGWRGSRNQSRMLAALNTQLVQNRFTKLSDDGWVVVMEISRVGFRGFWQTNKTAFPAFRIKRRSWPDFVQTMRLAIFRLDLPYTMHLSQYLPIVIQPLTEIRRWLSILFRAMPVMVQAMWFLWQSKNLKSSRYLIS